MIHGMDNTKVHEDVTLRNKTYVFEDRDHAAQVLLQMLRPYYERKPDTIVLGIPSGGVPIAVTLAMGLGLPMDLIIVRKIPIPGNPEAGMGAISLAGGLLLNQPLIQRLGITPGQIEAQLQRVRQELERRNQLFRQDRPMMDLRGKEVILADDGLASGFTTLAAVNGVDKAGAKRIIVAAPTGSDVAIERLSGHVHEIFCPNIRAGYYFAVADAYRNWYDLGPEEVIERLSSVGYMTSKRGDGEAKGSTGEKGKG